MPHPAPRNVVAWVLLALASGTAAAQSAPERPAQSIARHAIRDFKYRPPPVVSEEVPAVLKSKAEKQDAPVVLPVYVVRGVPDRTLKDVSDALDTLDRIDSGAVFKTPRLEALLPPTLETSRQGDPRVEIKILKFRF
ncbi:MAG TPA: hypothetical protein VHO24_00910 [Opitutaceae bacterium]|nr:hypothetical protein [Opitutaceae bacterium]